MPLFSMLGPSALAALLALKPRVSYAAVLAFNPSAAPCPLRSHLPLTCLELFLDLRFCLHLDLLSRPISFVETICLSKIFPSPITIFALFGFQNFSLHPFTQQLLCLPPLIFS